MRRFLLAGLVFLGASAFAGAAAQELRLGHFNEATHPWHLGFLKAAELIKERTGGKIVVTVFPSAVLGYENELLEQVITGGLDICQAGTGSVANVYAPMNISEMPYVFRDQDHAMLFIKSDKFQEIREGFRKHTGGRIVASGIYGLRHILGNKPIHRPQDLSGFKLRAPDQRIAISYVKVMGAQPTPLAINEAYMALQQKICDGFENPLTAIYSFKVYEVAKHLSLTGHIINIGHVVMNGDVYDALSVEERKIFKDSFEEAMQHIYKLILDGDATLLDFFAKQGVSVAEADRDAFREKTKSMSDEYAHTWAEFGDLYQYIQALK